MATDYTQVRKRYMELSKDFRGQLPKTFDAFMALHKETIADGALSGKHKELIALAISIAARCQGCIAFHVHDALKAGASPTEVAETIGVAVMMGGGPAMMYAYEAFDALAQSRE